MDYYMQYLQYIYMVDCKPVHNYIKNNRLSRFNNQTWTVL